KLPVERQFDEMERVAAEYERRDAALAGLMPSCGKVASAHTRSQASLRCAAVAVALERYRRAHDAWPVSLDLLVQTGYLKIIPNDPFDGEALRYRPLGDGVLVYSVGYDRV